MDTQKDNSKYEDVPVAVPSDKKKLKVLFLHGFRQSGDTLIKKTGSFRKILKPYVDFVYITAPHYLEDDPVDGKTYYWWDAGDSDYISTKKYIGDKESIRYVIEFIKKEGPFDGIIGYSQGAVLASILCKIGPKFLYSQNLFQSSDNLPPNPFGLKFCMLFCGFEPNASPYNELINDSEQPIVCPTLHAYGTQDAVVPVEFSKKLAAIFKSQPHANKDDANFVIEHEHEGGHYIPTNSKEKQLYRTFLERFV